MEPRRIVITGMGWVTPLGHDIESTWSRILRGDCGVSPTALFDASTFPTSFSAQVRNFQLADFLGADAARHKCASRNTEFALAAAMQAWRQAGLDSALALDPTSVGVYLGGGEGPLDFDQFAAAAMYCTHNESGEVTPLNTTRWAEESRRVFDFNRELEQEQNLACGHLACQFKAAGPNFNTLTACAASTQAIGEATQRIRYGEADVMITGGAHTMIHPLGITGFNRLTALSTRNDDWKTASRPFDRTRDGFVIGEGAGILTLEELQHARERGALVLAEVVGYGSTADAFRITDIHEDGRGAVAAMNAALKSASMTPADIGYISAHGTGTEENDKIETLAIKKVFGDRAKQVPVSSVKSMVGHLIAAAGAVELITCVLAMRDGIIPPTINYAYPDTNCDLDYVPNEARQADVHACLSNSFGFGGQNDTLIVRKFQD
jgi:3-oxoacyl-[acyl-carrier-protein] synthase II